MIATKPPMHVLSKPFGYASRDFNGTSHFVTMPDPSAGGANLTAACWVKTSDSDNKHFLSHYDYGTGNRSWYLGLSTAAQGGGTKLRVAISDDGTLGAGSAKIYWTTTGTVADGAWHHIALTFASGVLKLFIDGVDQSVTKPQDDAITTIHNSTSLAAIGSLLNSGSWAFGVNSKIADCRIYDADIGVSQVAKLAAGIDYQTDLVGWWIQNTDDTLDYAGSNDGTNTGSIYSTDGPLDP